MGGDADGAGEMGVEVGDGDDMVQRGDLGGEAVEVGPVVEAVVAVDADAAALAGAAISSRVSPYWRETKVAPGSAWNSGAKSSSASDLRR